MKGNRVLIIGIDGGDWNLLRPLMQEGLMPNLRTVVEGGAGGILRSTIPPLTAPAWTSFMTGVSPATHGIVEFNNYDGNYGTYFVTNASIKQKTIWELASEQGLRIISINVPMTYPPYPVRGYMITGLLTPDTTRFTYPPSLGREILEEFGEYKIVETGKAYFLHGISHFIDELKNLVTARADVATYLLSTRDWDLAMVHFQSSDVLQHFAYHCIDPSFPLFKDSCHGEAKDFYRILDRSIGEVIEHAERKGVSLKLFLSDHGFVGVHTTIILNALLARYGYLKFKPGSFTERTLRLLLSLGSRISFLKKMRWGLKWKTRERIISLLAPKGVDFSSSMAFSINGSVYGNIFINVEGRHPSGIVKERDYLRFREELKQRLEEEEGIQRVLTREEAYGNSQEISLPDLIVVPEDGFTFSLVSLGKRAYLKRSPKKDRTGNHRIEGIWAVHGEGVSPGAEVNAEIIDLLPTIFWYMGLAIPSYVEGRVIKEAFQDEFSSGKKEIRKDISPDRRILELYREEGIEEKLHDLGYL